MTNPSTNSVLNKYPFDPHGVNNQNIVVDERQLVTVKNGYDFHYLIPDYAPFFSKDFKMYIITQKGAKQYLTLGVDYVFSYRFIEAIVSTGNPIFGAISFINQNFSGEVWIEYRTVGGDWNVPKQKVQEIIANTRYNPRTATWDQVADLPYQFPPTNHTHHTKDLTEFKDVVDAVNKIVDALNRKAENPDVEIIVNNVLARITKKDVGLGDVENLPLLPVDRIDDNSNDYYVTPLTVREIIKDAIAGKVNSLTERINSILNMNANDFDAYTKAQTDELLNKRLGKSETAANTSKFNDKDYEAVVEDILSRAKGLTVNNSEHFGGLSPEEFVNNVLSMNIDATTLSGSTKEQIIDTARENVNATRLGGQTLQDIMDVIRTHVPDVSEDSRKLGGKTPEELISDYKLRFVNMTGASRLGDGTKGVVSIGEMSNSKGIIELSLDNKKLGDFFISRDRILTADDDLNELNLNDLGVYSIIAAPVPSPLRNYPINKTGVLMVLPGAQRGRQLYIPDDTPKMFIRSSTGGDRDWYDWQEIGTGNIVKLHKKGTTESSVQYIVPNSTSGWASTQGNDGILKFTKHNVVNDGFEIGLPLVEITMPNNKTGMGHVLATTTDVSDSVQAAITALKKELFDENGKLKSEIIPPAIWA